MLSFELDKILPEFVRELLAEIIESPSEKISALAWLIIESALMVLFPKDFIAPELSRLPAVKEKSFAL